MATIYWRGDRAYLNWSQGGIQYRKSLGRVTPDEADRRLKAKEFELSTGRRVFLQAASFEDHLQRYLTWHRSQFPDSHWRVAQIAAQHLGDFRGVGLSQIEAPMIEVWKAKRMQKVARETVAKELRTLKAILEKAVKWGEIEHNPARYVEAPKSIESEPIQWYSKAQLARLYRMHHGQVWRLMANTGMRRGEAQQLDWSRVDMRARRISIVSTESARTKSGRWRQIPLSDNALAALKALKKRRGKDGYVLPLIDAASLTRAFRKAARRLGLAGSLHSLRHSYGAHLVMAGVPLRTLQVLMGHASFKTTERYAHIGKDHLRDKARLVNL